MYPLSSLIFNNMYQFVLVMIVYLLCICQLDGWFRILRIWVCLREGLVRRGIWVFGCSCILLCRAIRLGNCRICARVLCVLVTSCALWCILGTILSGTCICLMSMGYCLMNWYALAILKATSMAISHADIFSAESSSTS